MKPIKSKAQAKRLYNQGTTLRIVSDQDSLGTLAIKKPSVQLFDIVTEHFERHTNVKFFIEGAV